MAEEKKSGCIFPRLQLAYLFQFAIWGSWNIALGGYLAGKLQEVSVGGLQLGTGWIYNAYPIGVILAALFIGPIADRYLAAQKMLGLLQLINGAALVACGFVCKSAVAADGVIPFWPLMILMLVSGICFLPSIPLINAVVFKHIPDNSKTPSVFIFGTLGWIIVNLVIELFCGGATTPNFFFVGGGIALFYGLYAFSLPDTPPKGAPAPGEKSDALGLGALAMFKDAKFTIFILCAFLVSIFGSNFYFPALAPYLTEHGYPAPVALGTINQFSELVFMALLAVCVARIGLKWVLVLGMAAWGIRYIIFTQEGFSFAMIAILLHGMAYAFLYTASYMFGDKVAPDNLKASVQSLLAFLLLGVGQLLSGVCYDNLINQAKPDAVPLLAADGAAVMDADGKEVNVPQFASWSESSNLKYLELAKSLKYVLGDKRAFDAIDLGDYAKEDGTISADDLKMAKLEGNIKATDDEKAAVGDGEILMGSYPNIAPVKTEDIVNQIKSVEVKAGKDSSLTRDDWLKVQRHDWTKFFTFPAYFVIFWVVVFILFGREPTPVVLDKKEESNAEKSAA